MFSSLGYTTKVNTSVYYLLTKGTYYSELTTI